MSGGWKAQEYYNNYLELKEELAEVDHNIRTHFYDVYNLKKWYARREDLTEQLYVTLEMLELLGISMKDLVLLSAGVDVDLFGQN